MTKRHAVVLGMFALGVGYFLWYAPYSALAKSISGGYLPGVEHPVGGLILLPATVLGQLLAMPVFVLASGWWRYSRRRRIGGRDLPFPVRYTAESAFWMAFIVGTTTINFTFPGASIVFMLVLMRIGTLIISPIIDLVRRRKIHWYSAVALVLCMASAIIALTDINNYKLTAGAVLSLGFYCLGYFLRFGIMSKYAKTGNLDRDRQYFIEEHMATPVLLLLMVGIPALVNQGPWMHALHLGFTSFLTTSAAIPALLIGVCYEGLYIMTSLIFLDRREFSFGMPVHVCSSLLAGVVASLILHRAFDTPQPSSAQYIAATAVICAALALSYPTIKARLAARHPVWPASAFGSLLFICGGNTTRSPMAAAIARAELRTSGVRQVRVSSAGVAVDSVGAPLNPDALTALRRLGVDTLANHTAQQLTPEICAGADAIYCMTRAQCDAVVAVAPEAVDRTYCLDSEADLPDPAGQSAEVFRESAVRLQTLIRELLHDQRKHYALSMAEGT